MDNLVNVKELKGDLFKLTVFCHDHSGTFQEKFMSTHKMPELTGFYFSGSKCVVTYLDQYVDCVFYLQMKDLLDWVVDEGFVL